MGTVAYGAPSLTKARSEALDSDYDGERFTPSRTLVEDVLAAKQ